MRLNNKTARVGAQLLAILVSYIFRITGITFNSDSRTSVGSSTFGVVTLTQANDPRIGQLTARINF